MVLKWLENMNILLTNDDGYDSIGIKILKDCLSKYGHVYVVAPSTSMSGKSSSITLDKPLYLYKDKEDTYICDGTPVDCVRLGVGVLKVNFDLVVSGCNNGLNISFDTLYSGTIGATMQAMIENIPAVAVSTPNNNFDIVKKYFDAVYLFIESHKLISNEYVLNVNFPYGETIDDIKLSKLHFRNNEHWFVSKDDGYIGKRKLEDNITDTDTDCYMVDHHIVSITPLARSLFNQDIYESLLEKMK